MRRQNFAVPLLVATVLLLATIPQGPAYAQEKEPSKGATIQATPKGAQDCGKGRFWEEGQMQRSLL